jgi:hypothetical protein
VLPVHAYSITRPYVVGEHFRTPRRPHDALVTRHKGVASPRDPAGTRTDVYLLEERIRIETLFAGAEPTPFRHDSPPPHCHQLMSSTSDATSRVPRLTRGRPPGSRDAVEVRVSATEGGCVIAKVPHWRTHPALNRTHTLRSTCRTSRQRAGDPRDGCRGSQSPCTRGRQGMAA